MKHLLLLPLVLLFDTAAAQIHIGAIGGVISTANAQIHIGMIGGVVAHEMTHGATVGAITFTGLEAPILSGGLTVVGEEVWRVDEDLWTLDGFVLTPGELSDPGPVTWTYDQALFPVSPNTTAGFSAETTFEVRRCDDSDCAVVAWVEVDDAAALRWHAAPSLDNDVVITIGSDERLEFIQVGMVPDSATSGRTITQQPH